MPATWTDETVALLFLVLCKALVCLFSTASKIFTYQLQANFSGVPLRAYSATDLANKVPVTAANLVTIERITVINDSPTTAANSKSNA